MSRIGILTDTTNCLPPELIKQYSISVVPVGLVIDGKTYRDQFDITPAEFWNKFMTAEEIPGTSAPSPGDIEALFTELSQSYDDIVCILVSKILSATQSSAVLAKEQVLKNKPKLRIEIIDSKCAAGAMGFMVLEAARAAQAGKSFEEVIKVVQDMLPKVTYLTALDTMKYLVKGGRAPKTAIIGDLLQVKPIITNNKKTGAIDNAARATGTKKAMQKLVDMVPAFADTNKPLHMMVHFTNKMADGEELKRLVTSRYNCVELYFTRYTPVIAAHTGPVLSLAFYSE
jgi:DegV family protein with EDD domain